MDRVKIFGSFLFLAILLFFSIAFFALPRQTYSMEERRFLSNPPELSVNNVVHASFGKDLEMYLADHFPGRKFLVGLYHYVQTYSGRNGENGVYIGKNSRLFSIPSEKGRMMENINAINDFTAVQKLDADIMIVPSAGFVLAEQLPFVHRTYHDQELLKLLEEQLNDYINDIDLAELFRQSFGKEKLYFKTDHHWTSDGAYLAYVAYCDVKGITPIAENYFLKQDYDGFYGTNYAKSGLWLVPPDSITIWQPPGEVAVEIMDDDLKSGGCESSPFFPEDFYGNDPYNIYFNGNHSLVRIVNENISNGKLLIVKDSYANAFAPFLSQHYHEIDMVDLRYFRKQNLSDFIAENEITKVLYLFGLSQLTQDANFIWLK